MRYWSSYNVQIMAQTRRIDTTLYNYIIREKQVAISHINLCFNRFGSLNRQVFCMSL